MDDRSTLPEGLAVLDAMIARAEAACERGRRKMEVRRWASDPRHKAAQQKMEDTLARLRAQREAAARLGQQKEGRPLGCP